ncbi:hypothetical protein C5N14_18325 [Micromonospora sp. MW-13]|uniref:DUF3618 domain-containing protein n=1 Tax=unclassified Micromonospora TaxID=2617518 RepID=UPI000E4507FF|nr:MULTISPECIES: DUF3618 domain-containing protein [unclassified Micromonospora]MCX4473265.1 DUF3618 domain-containing protein [Micromonospora sp. NBC_01655]RGC67309.1 hypothetical protein C5N14_18325 [Micromonospora sp. MW-13]
MTGNGTGDTEALREEIRRTRVELGETMEALAAKADVKARLRSSAEQAKGRMRKQAAQTVARVREQATQSAGAAREASSAGAGLRGPVPWAAVAAGAVATMIVLLIVRGRRR